VFGRRDFLGQPGDRLFESSQFPSVWQFNRFIEAPRAGHQPSPGHHADGGSFAEILVGRSATRLHRGD
jgi:hypothetical protein